MSTETVSPPEIVDDVRRAYLLQVVASAVTLAVFVLAWYTARDFTEVARWFPTAVALAGAVLTAIKLVTDVRAMRTADASSPWPLEREEDEGSITGIVVWIGLVAALLVLSRVVGFMYGTVVWLPVVLLVVSKVRWYTAGIAAAAIYTLLWCGEVYLAMRWPPGIFDLSGVGF